LISTVGSRSDTPPPGTEKRSCNASQTPAALGSRSRSPWAFVLWEASDRQPLPRRGHQWATPMGAECGRSCRLRRSIPYEDLTLCLSTLPVSKVFIEGGTHYSPEGNARVATCLAPVLRDYMVGGNDSLDSASKK
jgi:hypothetical protein